MSADPNAQPPPPGTEDAWAAVDRLVDSTDSYSNLRRHRLHLWAAEHWRRLGRPLPIEASDDVRIAGMSALASPVVLQRVRAAYDGRLLLLKGPEAAAFYPNPGLRPLQDLDLLAEDAGAAQRQLLAAGFRMVGTPELYVGIHHLRPLAWPGLPLFVELHERPKWFHDQAAPSVRALFEAAVPSRCGIEGIEALPPAHHAVLLAAHSWAHVPLNRVGHLLDIHLTSLQCEHRALEELAREWRAERVWRATARAAETILADGRGSMALQLWARNLSLVRERTVLESHLERVLAPFWALAPLPALAAMVARLRRELSPVPGETWIEKVSRSRIAVRNGMRPLSEHQRELGPRLMLGAGDHYEVDRHEEVSPTAQPLRTDVS